MKTTIDKILFTFINNCNCEGVYVEKKEKINTILGENNTPVCSVCGVDYILCSDCEVL